MKKIRTLSFILTLILFIANVIPVQVNAASNIYFAGEYTCKKVKDSDLSSDKIPVSISMSEYSSIEGKIYGVFTITIPIRHLFTEWNGTLKKTAKNTYVFKDGKVKFTFKVSKKKVVIKQNRTDDDTYFYNISGTYKLTKRYPRP
jgi:hypothetical protein